MQLHKINKKGQIFLFGYVIIYTIILISLFFTTISAANKKEDIIGLRAINLIKANQESDNIELYLDMAAKYSYENSLNKLAENGGYSEENRCEKTQPTIIDREEYVILNTCQVLDSNGEFQSQLKKEIKYYLNIYESSYTKTSFKDDFNIEKEYPRLEGVPEKIKDDYNYIYTQAIKNTKIEKIEQGSKNLIIAFSDVILPIENDEISYLNLKPEISIDKPDFTIYKEIHLAINNYCIKKDKKTCEEALKIKFKDINIYTEGILFKIIIPYNNYKIKLAFYNDKMIPLMQDLTNTV
ncbi:hypothetical protein J4230_05685 [Candidatus Woesearchaeota archaeon]|nr:hypothetical protein [Candidatus Woesearchaeota archaeon]